MEGTLEGRLQADFSGVLASEQGPFAMGVAYVSHLLTKNPLAALLKAGEMAKSYAAYLVRKKEGNERLEEVFSVYAGMPEWLIGNAASSMTLNPRFVDALRAYRAERGLERCIVDICTRDAIPLVEAFAEQHQKELEEAGISIGTITGNTLEVRYGALTGSSDVPITLVSKPLFLDTGLPYFTTGEEYSLYRGILPLARRI